MIIVPLRQLPNDTTTVRINDQTFKVNTMWNSREQAWYFSVRDSGDNPLVLGFKMLHNQNMTDRHGLIEFIDGDFYCININQDQSRPVFEDLGVTLLVAYLTKAETLDVIANYSDIVIYN